MNAFPQHNPPRHDPRGHLIEELRRQLGRAGTAAQEWATPAADLEIFSSGAAALDRLLPGGGLRHGMLVEWLGGENGRAAEQKSSRTVVQQSRNYCTTALPLYCSSSAATLSLLAAREACRQGGVLVVIDQQQTFYPPAAAAWGIDLARLIVVHPRNTRDALWAAVQSLRSPAVAAVWTAIDRLDSRAFRRLQLAAQSGRTLGLLLRPAKVRGQPSWADVSLVVGEVAAASGEGGLGKLQIEKCKLKNANWQSSAIENLQFRAPPVGWSCNLQSSTVPFATRRVPICLLRSRGARPGGRVTLEIDDATHTVREVEEGYRLSAVGYQPSLLADSR